MSLQGFSRQAMSRQAWDSPVAGQENIGLQVMTVQQPDCFQLPYKLSYVHLHADGRELPGAMASDRDAHKIYMKPRELKACISTPVAPEHFC